MNKGRLEAFTDAVIAIVMTILVLELPKIDGVKFENLWEVREPIVMYVVSFIMLSIYWNNHHHMFQLIKNVDGKVLWANNIFIFFLSLFPFTTNWMGEHIQALAPQVTFGVMIFLADAAYSFMIKQLYNANQDVENVQEVFNNYKKMPVTLILNVVAIGAAFIWPPLTTIMNFIMILIWLIPDKRIERQILGE
jgi:uncharacterized membrane protein